MKKVVDIFKGIFIGVSNVIPGFSGGTMAVILGVYERIINSISELSRRPIKALKELWALIIGLVIGVILASFTIVCLLKQFPLQTIMLFVGMIIGTLPNIAFEIKKFTDKNKKCFGLSFADILVFLICFLIMIVLPIINSGVIISEINIFALLFIFVMGIVSACAMVIPGISGSLVLMVFGIYVLILEELNIFISALFEFDFNDVLVPFFVLLIFAFGVIVGILIISKLIRQLFEKRRRTVYCGIFALLFASIFSIIYTTIDEFYEIISWDNILVYVVCVLMILLGSIIVFLLSNYEKRKVIKKEE